MVGGVPSPSTVMVNVQVLRLVQSSVATQVTAVTPPEKELPEAGAQVTVTLGDTLSVATGSGKDTGNGFVPQISRNMLVGHWIVGGVVSRFTVRMKVHVARSPHPLVAVQLTVDVPKGNRLLAGGVQDTCAAKRQLFETAGSG